jgi:hypothetical protein
MINVNYTLFFKKCIFLITAYTISLSKDNEAARRRRRESRHGVMQEADDPGLRRGRLRQQS